MNLPQADNITDQAPAYTMDPVLMAVLANRLNAIVREMSNTLLRTARSAVLAVVRDFSCAIVTADNQLLCPGEGLPVMVVDTGTLVAPDAGDWLLTTGGGAIVVNDQTTLATSAVPAVSLMRGSVAPPRTVTV